MSAPRLVDDTHVALDWIAGSIVCAHNRLTGAPAPIEVLPKRGLRCNVIRGDRSKTEDDQYGKVVRVPKRAFLVPDIAKGERGQLIQHDFRVRLEPGPPLIHPLFCVLDQENARPPDWRWRPPPIEFGVLTKPIAGSKLCTEWLYLKGHVWDEVAGKAADVGLKTSLNPVARGQEVLVRIRFRDGGGGEGYLGFWTNNGLRGEYTGPLGYEGFGLTYPGFGAYLHEGQPDFAATFWDWKRTIVC